MSQKRKNNRAVESAKTIDELVRLIIVEDYFVFYWRILVKLIRVFAKEI
jgi:hypothetical protein